VRDLADVAPIAVPGAVGQSAVATLLGLGLSQLWGWSLTEGIVFGLCLSVASTVVLLRALEDQNLLETPAGHVAVGWLIVEDLFTVLILVLLPALEGSGGGKGLASLFDGDNQALEVVFSLTQAAVFVVLMLRFGVKLIPFILREVVRAGSRELFTLCILAIALGVAFGSSELFGASLALGAFLAGVVLNESELSHRAGLEALPLRDAFAVVFFVSVGMLFDPAVLLEQPERLLDVAAIIIAGKAAAAFLIVTGMGFGTRPAVVVGAALAQIGEFSFILAALATTLGVLPDEAISLVLGGAIISITLNPFIFGRVDQAEDLARRWSWFERFSNRRYQGPEVELAVRRHVVICGYGRTGANLARTLAGRGLPFVIIENNPFVYERAREGGVPGVLGDCTQPVVLEQARIRDARTIAVTFDSVSDAPLTAQQARNLNPGVDVIARSAGADASRLLREAGATEVVDPHFETSIEFVRHVLHLYGVDAREITALQTQRRVEYYRSL
jgi:CPA2 family monovalent cation:H+ antiporter-2